MARVAVVTGGTRGIGAAISRALKAAGCTVAANYGGNDEAAQKFKAETGIAVYKWDVSSFDACAAGIKQVEAELGPIDILVCSAGVPGRSLKTVEVDDAEWKRVLAINTDGVFFSNRAVLASMVARGYGRIVNVASIAGKEGNPMAAAYSASKAAVIALTKSIAKDVARTGVLVNCVAPAVIDTPILEGITEEHVGYMVERIPMGRIGTVEEVAALVCWLASEECSFSTGAAYDISGGRAVY